MNRRHLCRGALCAILFFVPAAVSHAHVLDTVLDKYQAAASHWTSTFFTYANGLFWLLAGIDVAWSAVTLALRNADIQEFVSEIVREVLVIGFFYALLANGTTWVPAIIDSFREIGTAANTAAGGRNAYSPSYIMDIALEVATLAIEAGGLFDVFIVGLFGLGIMITAAMIAATMVIAICEMYIVSGFGIVLLGFGGARWTRDYATKLLTYALSVGVKLALIQLLVGLGESFIRDFANEAVGSDLARLTTIAIKAETLAPITVALVVLLALVRSLPNTAQSIITGVSIHTHGTFAAGAGIAAATYGSAGAVVTTATGALGALTGAAKLASAQGAAAALTSAGGAATATAGAGSSPVATAAAATGAGLGLGSAVKSGISYASRVAGNLVKATGADIAKGVKGESREGTLGHRMAASLSKDAQSLATATALSKPLMAPTGSVGPTTTPGNPASSIANAVKTAASNDGGSAPAQPPAPSPKTKANDDE